MDAEHFDRIVRLVSHASSRRRVLACLIGGALGSALSLTAADARKKPKGKRKSKRKSKPQSGCADAGQTPGAGQSCCGDLILDGAGRCVEPPPPTCADTCAGCCQGETCRDGDEDTACGAGGASCLDCATVGAGHTCGGCGDQGCCDCCFFFPNDPTKCLR